MSNSFNVMETNPNLGNGSNGCLCSELGNADTKGPFIVFAATETDNIFAPFPVLCAHCACRAAELVPQPEGVTLVDIAESTKPKRARHNRPLAEMIRDEDGPSI